MEERDWLTEPYHRRTKAEHAIATNLIEEFVAANDCRYPVMYLTDIAKLFTAEPKTADRHQFSPTERVTLDFDGRF